MSAASDRLALAQEAFIWGLPLVLMHRSLGVSQDAGLPLNQVYLTTELAVPKFRQVGPNVDTLMGHAWLDLSDGPQVIGVPDSQDRYYSIQLQDMYMNTFAYIGPRMTDGRAAAVAIMPRDWRGELPEGVGQIRSATTMVLAYIRTMLKGPEDLEAARAVHFGYSLGSLADWPNGRTKPIAREGRARLFPHFDFSKPDPDVFAELQKLVRAYPPLDWDAPNLARFEGLGTDADLAEAIPEAYARIRRSLNLIWKDGWARRENVPAFLHDPLQRAANNFFGKGTHRSDEAVYWGTYQGGMGDWLDGRKRYRLRFPPGGAPPVDAFWSLTLYDGDYVLFDNPLGRHAILDRTEGLVHGADGALEIQIQADEPAEGVANWLPAPRGDFQLMVRAYLPRREIMDWSYTPPPLEIV
jgi:hypothetical protein